MLWSHLLINPKSQPQIAAEWERGKFLEIWIELFQVTQGLDTPDVQKLSPDPMSILQPRILGLTWDSCSLCALVRNLLCSFNPVKQRWSIGIYLTEHEFNLYSSPLLLLYTNILSLHLRLFGQDGLCSACDKRIRAYEMTMRVKDKVYHLECFKCAACQKHFCVGDRYLLINSDIVCEQDIYEWTKLNGMI